jgi:hypothetical protein
VSSFDISFVEREYEGTSENERLEKFAKEGGYWRIYKYKNAGGDEYTDYKVIRDPTDPGELNMFESPHVRDPMLVYER